AHERQRQALRADDRRQIRRGIRGPRGPWGRRRMQPPGSLDVTGPALASFSFVIFRPTSWRRVEARFLIHDTIHWVSQPPMSLFGRKPPNGTRGPATEYRFMLDLDRARVLGAMIAKSRASEVIEIADLLAGMYISNWDRLSRYWRVEKQEDVEEFLRKICQI